MAENLEGCRLSGELDYTFAVGTSIPAGGFLVVAPAPADVAAVYGITGVLGGTNTRLNNRSGTIRLHKFEVPSGTQIGPAGLIAYDRNQLGFAPSPAGGSLYLVSPDRRRVLDAVRYGGQAKGIATGRFPEGAPEFRELVTSTPGTPNAGLLLIDPRSDHRRAANWADSDETGKSDWTHIEFTGVCDNGAGYSMNNLQIILLAAGECLIDNVEVIGPGGTNRVANSTFENGLTNWVGQGSHEQISLESLGSQSDLNASTLGQRYYRVRLVEQE